MDAAACIGCGACVAACPNSSAMLFVAAKIAHLGTLPQGRPEEPRRALSMTEVMQEEGFGACSNHFECQAVCPKGIQVETIARLNRAFLRASLKRRA
jgi:succinate dehydrogenase / fumarate reductase iron-sulfur subunit